MVVANEAALRAPPLAIGVGVALPRDAVVDNSALTIRFAREVVVVARADCSERVQNQRLAALLGKLAEKRRY